jgi:hypothetical protein
VKNVCFFWKKNSCVLINPDVLVFICGVSSKCLCTAHSIKLLLSAADSLLTALDEVNNAYRNTLCSQFKALPWGWNYHSFWNASVTPRAKLPFFLEWHCHPEGNGMLFYNLTLSPRGQRFIFYNMTLLPRGQRSNFYNLTLSPRGNALIFIIWLYHPLATVCFYII